MNPVARILIVSVSTYLLAVSVSYAQNQCFYFPRKFLDGSDPPSTNHACHNSVVTAEKLKNWNEFLKRQTNFLKTRLCISKTENGLQIDTDCMNRTEKRLEKLIDRPQCCNAFKGSDISCYFDVSDPCLELDDKYDKHLVFNSLCKKKLLCEKKRCSKDMLVLNSLHYYTAGCAAKLSDVPQYRNLAQKNEMTLALLQHAFCHKARNQSNCCSGHLCNLPAPAAASFYAQPLRSILPAVLGIELATGEEEVVICGVKANGYTAVLLATGAVCFLAVLTICSALVVVHYRYRWGSGAKAHPKDSSSSEKLMSVSSPTTNTSTHGDTQQSTFASYVQNSDNSQTGSGAGTPILVPRTIAREVALGQLIGQGRFGQVFKATWRGDPVAVKIFSSRAECSWSTEGSVYELPGMRHDSVLGFVAIDNIDVGWETQLWLITTYHPMGSLQNVLSKQTIDQVTMAGMAASIASGVAHLHTQICGVKSKPSIAHRDIKSNNILVKADMTCCIADFGLAVCQKSEAPPTWESRVGTKRYLSPECLDGSIAFGSFGSLLQSDIYSLGLVLWEVATRCDDPRFGIRAGEYEQPYQNLVSANPSIEEMQDVVCQPASLRPELPPAWHCSPVLGRLSRIVTECWYGCPSARLEALPVKEQTARLQLAAREMQQRADELAAGQTVV